AIARRRAAGSQRGWGDGEAGRAGAAGAAGGRGQDAGTGGRGGEEASGAAIGAGRRVRVSGEGAMTWGGPAGRERWGAGVANSAKMGAIEPVVRASSPRWLRNCARVSAGS
ncbi:MAG: hypothetical protein LBD77_11415, partial [Bifidobacteriaceae bacterium]|nr:hypothetical protein [Bifidobacteriaceae bacterium]